MKSLKLMGTAAFLFISNSSCSTSTKTARVVKNTTSIVTPAAEALTNGALPIPAIPLGLSKVPHQIEIKGMIICEAQPWQNLNSLQIELKESDKVVFQIPTNSNGEYNSTIKSFEGKHKLILLQKRTSKILDQVEFISTHETDRFEINLNSCKQ